MNQKVTASGREATEPIESSVPTSEKLADGQHKDHWILPESERAKGFIRPVRRTYIHEVCGGETSMGQLIAETYARQPSYYGQTFCCTCKGYFPVGQHGEFVWKDNPTEKVGT
jgi:hypothetical protein